MDDLDELYNWIKSNKLITSTDLTTQEDINDAYDAVIQQYQYELNARYIDKILKKNMSLFKRSRREFLSRENGIDADRLQTGNYLLTSKLQMDLLTCEKEVQNLWRLPPFRISCDKTLYNFSYLTKGAIKQGEKKVTVYFINTIQFNLENKKKDLSTSIAGKEAINLDKVITENNISSIADVVALADRVEEFSFHQYFLPFDTFDDAILLFRYDHTNKKHINCKPINTTMPILYNYVYPPFVEEPHFHFTTVFGNIYKLTKHNEDHNNGVGYAIGVSQLKEYLMNLYEASVGTVDAEFEDANFLENDFGMPFLHNIKNKGYSGISNHKRICRAMRKLSYLIKHGDKSAELALAIDIAHAFSNTENLNIHRSITDQNCFEY